MVQKPVVNGNSVAAGEYFEMIITEGDSICIKLPMEAVLIQANPNVEQDRGMLAVKEGLSFTARRAWITNIAWMKST